MRESKGKWYVRFAVDGVEYSEPTGLAATERNKKKALAMEATARQLVLDGKAHFLKIQAIPFNEAAASFLSWADGEYSGEKHGTFLRIRSSFGFIRHFFGKAIVSSITEGHIEDFKSARRKIGIKEVSIRHDLHALSVFYQYAAKKHWARENLVRKVEIPSDADSMRMNILSPADECKYFDACLWMDRAAQFIPSQGQDSYLDLHDFGRLSILQGCRPEEFIELRKSSVDLMSRWMFVLKGKSRAAKRRLKLTVESSAILARRMSRPGPFVFPSPRDPQKHRGPTWRVHGEVLDACGLAFVPYDLRHTFATRAAADGMPLPVLAATLGHANLRSVMKYVHITADHIDEGMIRLEQIRLDRMLAQGKSVASFLPVTPREEDGNSGKRTKSHLKNSRTIGAYNSNESTS